MITIGLIFVLYGIFSNNFLFSLIIILTGIILFVHSRQEPMPLPFQIAELGVIVGKRFYHYDELKSFYLVYQPPEVKTLFFETKNPLRPHLRVSLYDVNPLQVRDTLRQFLTEDLDHTEEPLSDMIARHWRIL